MPNNDETIISVFRESNRAINNVLKAPKWTKLKESERKSVKLALKVFVLKYVVQNLGDCDTAAKIGSIARKRCERLLRDADLTPFAIGNDATFRDAYRTIQRSAAVGIYRAGRRIGETAMALDVKYVNGGCDESAVYRMLEKARCEPESVVDSICEAFERYYSPSLC